MRTGKHKNCKIVGSYMGEANNDKKTPYFALEFQNEQNEYIDWIVWLSGGESAQDVIKRNLETLAKLGFKGKLSDLADGSKKISDLFGPAHDIVIVEVEEQPVTNADGTPKLKQDGTPITRQAVKWVNVGEGGLTKFDHKTAVAKFAGLKFDGLLAEIKSGLGAPKNPQQSTGATTPANGQTQAITGGTQNFASDDIPF